MHTAGVLSFACDSIYLHSGDTPEAGHTRHTICRKQTHHVIHTKEGIDPERGDPTWVGKFVDRVMNDANISWC